MKKKIIFLCTGIFLLITLTVCTVTDYSDTGSAAITIPLTSQGRYIAGGGDEVEEFLLGFVRNKELYNFKYMEDEEENLSGSYMFTGIPTGEYSFLAIMSDKFDIISMAIQPVTIEAGMNEIYVQMGPGFEFSINNKPFDFTELRDFSLSFDGNIMDIGIPEEEMQEVLNLDIRTNAADMVILDFDGNESDEISYRYIAPRSELLHTESRVKINLRVIDAIQLNLESFDGSVNTYRIRFHG